MSTNASRTIPAFSSPTRSSVSLSRLAKAFTVVPSRRRPDGLTAWPTEVVCHIP